jgi:hypothetical protein
MWGSLLIRYSQCFWTSLRGAMVFVFLCGLGSGVTLAEENRSIFVDDVRLKGVPKAMSEQVPFWGPALAAEISGVMRDARTYNPMTLQNLEALVKSPGLSGQGIDMAYPA